LLQAIFFAELIAGFIYNHMATSHVPLKWFACKIGKNISVPWGERGKTKTFKE
jgi:hypothetical protein